MKKVTDILSVLLLVFMVSCSTIRRDQYRMVPIGETMAFDNKKKIVYVLFRCIEIPERKFSLYCGMIVQMDMELYGETYIGETRKFNINKTIKQ